MALPQTVLVVEDDDLTRQTIIIILENMGLKVLPFATAVGLIEKIKDSPIDLALLDVMLPEKTGYEFAAELRNSPAFAQLPIVMVTARVAESDILDGYKLGADYYITKPFTVKQLEEGVRLYLKSGPI